MFVPSTQERQKIPTSQITRGSPDLFTNNGTHRSHFTF